MSAPSGYRRKGKRKEIAAHVFSLCLASSSNETLTSGLDMFGMLARCNGNETQLRSCRKSLVLRSKLPFVIWSHSDVVLQFPIRFRSPFRCKKSTVRPSFTANTESPSRYLDSPSKICVVMDLYPLHNTSLQLGGFPRSFPSNLQ
jgi:hypothetical protein